ncbi:YitT family protein [Erysipelothrix aquatica]|uniref:YitT family protein n=1 Tax=Erysipelothrix aquatica TaxID=2683714 RepID=UPI001356E63B|nr:YitT family protein [Erysipelothrix aquatica]
MFKTLNHYFQIIVGVALVSFAINQFLAPHDIAAGGASGIAILLYHVMDWEISRTVLTINVIMLISAFLLLGTKVFLKSLFGSMLLPFMLYWIPVQMLVEDRFLAVISGSVIFACGVALLYRNQASSGGTTIPPLIMKKYFGIDKSIGLLMSDLIIVVASLFVFGMDSFVLAVISIVITMMCMNYLSTGFNQKISMEIISVSHHRDILNTLRNLKTRGLSVFPVHGGHMLERRQMILIVMKRSEYLDYYDLIHSIDPQAFMIVQNVKDVHGNGFTYTSIV